MKKAVLSVCVFLSSFAVLAGEVDVLLCEPSIAPKTKLHCKGIRNDYEASLVEIDTKVAIPEIRTLSITCGNEELISGTYTGYFAQSGGLLNYGMGIVSKNKGFLHGNCRIDVISALTFPRVTRISLSLKKSN